MASYRGRGWNPCTGPVRFLRNLEIAAVPLAVPPPRPVSLALSRRTLITGAAALAAVPVMAAPVMAAPAPVIAAAASLRFVMADLLAAFQDRTGDTVRVSFGASGTLAQQMRHGAPFEIFLSADETYIRALAGDGVLPTDGVIYAKGRLALIAPENGPLDVDSDLAGLAAMLGSGTLHRFAIANPAHAPYGIRAREALQHRGLWQALQPHLVLGENVAQAAQFAVSGNADGGLIAASLANAGPVAAQGRSALIPEDWHSPLNQRMALTAGAGPVAQAFFAFLQDKEAQAIFTKHGFALPGGA